MNLKKTLIGAVSLVLMSVAVFFISATINSPKVSASQTCTSITQHGVTWTFSTAVTCGQFANNDWWVVGPVTITDITPRSVKNNTPWTGPYNSGDSYWIGNGTVLNPKVVTDHDANGYRCDGSQAKLTSCIKTEGFDNSIAQFAWYDSSLNVAPSATGHSLVVPINTSVVSSISKDGPSTTSTSAQQLKELEALTVVGSAPQPGSFRPPMTGTDKSIPSSWNQANLNYGILKSYAPVAGTPDLASVKSHFEPAWTALTEGTSEQQLSPGQMPSYGRDQSVQLTEGILSLNLNYTQADKQQLYIDLVQYGIDVYGAVKEGTVFWDNGGLNNGRKAALVLAAVALNDSTLKSWADANQHYVFAEDRQTFYVSQTEVSTPRFIISSVPADWITGNPKEGCSNWNGSGGYCNRYLDPYTTSMIGTPEWGIQHATDGTWDGSNWASAYYRGINGAAFIGEALSFKLIDGGQAVWNYPAFFDYMDRYWGEEKGGGPTSQTSGFGGSNNIPTFAYNMWLKYRGGGTYVPPTPPTTSTTTLPVVPPTSTIPFAIGNHIVVAVPSSTGLTSVNVRSTPALGGSTNLLGTQSNSATGVITDGPTVANGVTWWNINYDSGVDGWSGQDNITVTSVGTPPVVPPTTTLTTPVITSPTNNKSFTPDTTSVTVTWAGTASNYLVRAQDLTDPTQNTLNGNKNNVYFDTYAQSSVTFPVIKGHRYDFWVHSGTTKSYSTEAEVYFDVASVISYSLNTTTGGTGSGTISGAQTTYTSGATATLTATPATGSTFSGWSGACTGTATTCTITMNGSQSVTANFTLFPPPPVTTLTAPTITSPANNTVFPGATTNVTITWSGDASNYLVRAQDLTDSTQNTLNKKQNNVYYDTYKTTSVTFPVIKGHSYSFWVHSGTTKTYSPESDLSFSVSNNDLVIISPANNAVLPAGTTNVTVTWDGTASNYLVRAQDLTDPKQNTKNNKQNNVYEDTYTSKTITFPVIAGHAYHFWVHAGTTSNYSPEVDLNFSVANPVAESKGGMFSTVLSGFVIIKDVIWNGVVMLSNWVFGK